MTSHPEASLFRSKLLSISGPLGKGNYHQQPNRKINNYDTVTRLVDSSRTLFMKEINNCVRFFRNH